MSGGDEHNYAVLPTALAHQQKKSETQTHKAMGKSLESTATLSNLLPTGAVFVNQLLSPIITNKGQCTAQLHHTLTLCILIISATASFFLRFTDTVKDENGKVRHGIITFNGLWVIDGEVKLSDQEKARYKIKAADFVHAFMTVLVFGVVAFSDRDVIKCFFPGELKVLSQMLAVAPAMVGTVCSAVFVLFPTKRHGIGYPLSNE